MSAIPHTADGVNEVGDLDDIVSFYYLTKLTPAEEKEIIQKLDYDSDLDWIVHRFVSWPSEVDGTEADILRIYKQQNTDKYVFHFFIDRQTLQDETIIIADQDFGALVSSDDAAADAQRRVRDMHWDSIDYEIDEGLRHSAHDEFVGRGIAYARIGIADFSTILTNLETANMSLDDMVEVDLSVILDPEWDPVPFLRKVEEEKRKRDQLEAGQPEKGN
jgi:hypothetical protein